MNEKAESLFTQTFFRTHYRFNDVTVFRKATYQRMPDIANDMYQEVYTITKSWATDDPEIDKLF